MHPPATSISTRSDNESVVIGAIPARFASTRLPGKPLIEIAGRPMIEHVYERAVAAGNLSRVVVLTDDERIAEAVRAFGGDCQMTPHDCASGTDRVAWAARRWKAQAVVNIQGDEPLIEPRAIAAVASHLIDHPGDPLVTLATAAGSEDASDPNVVKVVTDAAGYAMYFSRSAIPAADSSETPRLRHIGIYGYQADALTRLAALEPTQLEQAEKLEQLRALENGMSIRVLLVEGAWIGIDTMEDLERVEARLAEARELPH